MHFWEPRNTWKTIKILHHYFSIQKQNQEHYPVVEEHYEDYHSLADKCLILYLANLIILGVLRYTIYFTYKCNVIFSFANRTHDILFL